MNRVMTVTQLASYLKGVFDDEELLHDVTLSGEVAEVSYSDRHTFLTLAEGDFSVRCVHFSARDKLEKGEKVALKGSVRFYDKRGAVSFSYVEFYVSGAGAKSEKLAALKEKLRGLGYFENRPQLPEYVVDVAVITSPDGAAIRDLVHVVSQKNAFVRIRVFPVKVQGDGAAAQMARAVDSLQNCRTDAIVLCRGGGSDEDLDSFNDEGLATSVAKSRIPVISAVGHEVDFTLCDFCAGTRAGTPSIAGEIINAHASALVGDLGALSAACRRAVERRLVERRRALEIVCGGFSHAVDAAVAKRIHGIDGDVRRGYYAVCRKTERRAAELDALVKRLATAAESKARLRRAECEKLQSLLRALDPHRIIRVGYAAVLKEGARVAEASVLRAGERIKLVFADGTATAIVESINSNGVENG